jgi:hypothetical protein
MLVYMSDIAKLRVTLKTRANQISMPPCKITMPAYLAYTLQQSVESVQRNVLLKGVSIKKVCYPAPGSIHAQFREQWT